MRRFSHDAYGPLFGSAEPIIEHSDTELNANPDKHSKSSLFSVLFLAICLIVSGLLLLSALT